MSMKRPWMAALLLVACCYGSLALAELTPVDPKTRQDIVFQILAQIASRVTGWEAQVTSAASYLFWTLGTISLSWTMGMMILKRADLGEFFAEFIRFIFFFGLFYALLRQGPNLARLILESMLQLGQQAAGSTIKYQSFISIGTELMSRADQFQQTGASKDDAFLVIGLCGGIFLMLTTMVINLFLVFVAGWFLMYAGIFFLGFGGSRWTSDIAIGYYKAVIAVGIQMFVMALIMGIATDVLGDFFDKFSYDLRFYELLSFLVATFAFMTIFNRIPPLLSGLISGASVGLSQGELGGALRGSNGADPFGAGRSALGTAVGGAQRLFEAVRAGNQQTQPAGSMTPTKGTMTAEKTAGSSAAAKQAADGRIPSVQLTAAARTPEQANTSATRTSTPEQKTGAPTAPDSEAATLAEAPGGNQEAPGSSLSQDLGSAPSLAATTPPAGSAETSERLRELPQSTAQPSSIAATPAAQTPTATSALGRDGEVSRSNMPPRSETQTEDTTRATANLQLKTSATETPETTQSLLG